MTRSKKMTEKELAKQLQAAARRLATLNAIKEKRDEDTLTWCIHSGRPRLVVNVDIGDRHNMWPRFATKAAALRLLLKKEQQTLTWVLDRARSLKLQLRKHRETIASLKKQLAKETR